MSPRRAGRTPVTADAGSARLALLASSDDYLLELALDEVIEQAREALGGAEVERLADTASPEDVAVELRSPSLFAAARVLVVGEVRQWLETTAPQNALKRVEATDEPEEQEAPEARDSAERIGLEALVAPLVSVLSGGVPEGMALVMGAWCGRQPKGRLVDAVATAGLFRWMPLPERPKPWEDAALSQEQWQVLSGLLAREAGATRFEADAERLLLERLGFEPRRLVQEARKLAAAAGPGRAVDEELVRRLVLPRERSLEVVRDGVLKRDPRPLLELIAAAADGISVNNWQGRPLPPDKFAGALCGQVANLFGQLLYLRRVADSAGLARELSPKRTAGEGWYQQVFSRRLGPVLDERLEADAPHPLVDRKGKALSRWTLGQLFRGAARFDDDELVAALAAAGEVELALRGDLGLEALTVWITRSLGSRPPVTERGA
jgi:hypothetical protein